MGEISGEGQFGIVIGYSDGNNLVVGRLDDDSVDFHCAGGDAIDYGSPDAESGVELSVRSESRQAIDGNIAALSKRDLVANYDNIPVGLNRQRVYEGFDPTPARADIVEGRVSEGSVRGTVWSEAKHLGGSVVSARFFTGEELGAKKIIAILLKDARCGRRVASGAGDDGSFGDRRFQAAGGGELCNGLRIDNLDFAGGEQGQSGTAPTAGTDTVPWFPKAGSRSPAYPYE